MFALLASAVSALHCRSFTASVEHQNRRVCCYLRRRRWSPRWSAQRSEFVNVLWKN